jgi:hypothetical protein
MKTRNRKELEKHWAEQAKKALKVPKPQPAAKGAAETEGSPSNQVQDAAQGSKET